VCQAHCFAHIDFLNTTTIRDSECNHCMACVAHCPKPNVLRVSGWTRSITPFAYGAMLVVGLFGLIGVSQLAGMWQTKPAAVSFTNANGKLDPESIRGWMTLDEISKGYSIPLDTLYTNTGLPRQVSPTTRLNAITREHKVEFEPDKVRDIVRSYVQGAPAPAHAPAKKAHSGGEEEVRGYMTLNEIALKTGVPAAGLRKALDLPDSIDARQPVREWMHAHGKSIQDLRDAVAAMRAKKR
jgi:ferredoxin